MNYRKVLKITLLLLVAILPLQLTGQTFANSRHYWSDGDLTWDSYLGTPTDTINAGGMKIGYSRKWEEVKKGNTTYSYNHFITFLNRYESWVADSARTDEHLLYDQTVFDIAELYCRKATIELYSPSYIGHPDDLFEFYYRQMEKRIMELDEKTDTGKVYLALMDYHTYIRDELEKTDFDPAPVDDIASQKSVLSMYLGYSLRAPLRGEFSPTHGLTLGYDFFMKRYLLGMAINLEGFGTSHVYVNTSKGPIHLNEKVRSGSIDLYLGRNVLRNSYFSLSPFAGCGVTFYDGTYYTNAQGERTSREIAGFTLMAGVSTDIIFRNNVRLYSGTVCSSNYSSLRLRPNFSYANMGHGLGWMPSLNLSVSFNFLAE